MKNESALKTAIDASCEGLALLDAAERVLWQLDGDRDLNNAISSVAALVAAAMRHFSVMHDLLETWPSGSAEE